MCKWFAGLIPEQRPTIRSFMFLSNTFISLRVLNWLPYSRGIKSEQIFRMNSLRIIRVKTTFLSAPWKGTTPRSVFLFDLDIISWTVLLPTQGADVFPDTAVGRSTELKSNKSGFFDKQWTNVLDFELAEPAWQRHDEMMSLQYTTAQWHALTPWQQSRTHSSFFPCW